MIRRPDTAVIVVIALTVLAFLVFLWIVSTAPAKSTTPKAWQPVPAALFSRWPAVPGWSGQLCSSTAEHHAGHCAAVDVAGSSPALAPTPTPSVRPHPTGGLIPPYVGFRGLAGTSTWYAYRSGQAAAGRALRDAIGADWRGATVRVCHAGRCLSVVLTDYESSLIPGRLIDLSSSDFLTLCGSLSKGICSVEVSR
jgi:hypothetical protein